MLSRLASAVIPTLGRLTITSDRETAPEPGTIIAANHTSLIDPGVVLAALRRSWNVEPVVLAAAGLWRIPLLGRLLIREGHIPVHRNTAHASGALTLAADALRAGRCVLIYGEGRLPRRKDAAEAEPETFHTGLARLSRLARATGAPIVPLGQAGARRISSGSRSKQIAGVLTAPGRRPRIHVHLGAPMQLPADVADATAAAHQAVTRSWRTAAQHLGKSAGLAA
ncbi:lysophospholipid acyltransferase family protein [Streptomyces sp. NPDC015125]|uniref:lysophospholipid acyltransferase family protein n=1 Tax=Streptomyces sp. NPDC015125 TaxID=3364938 RepID=UPI0036FE1BF6